LRLDVRPQQHEKERPVTDLRNRDCRTCDGTGAIGDSDLDLNNPSDLRAELTQLVTGTHLDSPDRIDRLNALARIAVMAGRLSWLDTSAAHTEALREKFGISAPEPEFVDATEMSCRALATYVDVDAAGGPAFHGLPVQGYDQEIERRGRSHVETCPDGAHYGRDFTGQ
jgi:hypothetical protein